MMHYDWIYELYLIIIGNHRTILHVGRPVPTADEQMVQVTDLYHSINGSVYATV